MQVWEFVQNLASVHMEEEPAVLQSSSSCLGDNDTSALQGSDGPDVSMLAVPSVPAAEAVENVPMDVAASEPEVQMALLDVVLISSDLPTAMRRKEQYARALLARCHAQSHGEACSVPCCVTRDAFAVALKPWRKLVPAIQMGERRLRESSASHRSSVVNDLFNTPLDYVFTAGHSAQYVEKQSRTADCLPPASSDQQHGSMAIGEPVDQYQRVRISLQGFGCSRGLGSRTCREGTPSALDVENRLDPLVFAHEEVNLLQPKPYSPRAPTNPPLPPNTPHSNAG